MTTTPDMSLQAGQRWQHVKRGTTYEVIGTAELQMSNDLLVDGSEMVVYRGDDGKLWAREEGEFTDGRFVLSTPKPEGETVTDDLPRVCDGKEQDAFEAWAASERYVMDTHPLHWLFLNERTWAARDGWKAGLTYAAKKIAASPKPTIVEASGMVDEYMTVTLSRDGTVTSHNAFDADFDEMVRATQTIVDALTKRLSDRRYCPYSHGSVLREGEPQSSVDCEIARIPAEAFWQVGHDGEGPDPSAFMARIFDPQTMARPVVARALTPHDALQKARASLSASSPSSEQGRG